MYLLFMGPYEQGGDFSDRGIGGVVRFLDRVWRLVTSRRRALREAAASGDARRAMHITIRRVTEDLEALQYNTAIAALMEYTRTLEALQRRRAQRSLRCCCCSRLSRRYMTEELWERIGGRRVHSRAILAGI